MQLSQDLSFGHALLLFIVERWVACFLFLLFLLPLSHFHCYNKKGWNKVTCTYPSVTQVYCEDNRRMELRFRPSDVYCKPTCGERHNSTALLLRVVRRRKKTTTRKKSGESADQEGKMMGWAGWAFYCCFCALVLFLSFSFFGEFWHFISLYILILCIYMFDLGIVFLDYTALIHPLPRWV